MRKHDNELLDKIEKFKERTGLEDDQIEAIIDDAAFKLGKTPPREVSPTDNDGDLFEKAGYQLWSSAADPRKEFATQEEYISYIEIKNINLLTEEHIIKDIERLSQESVFDLQQVGHLLAGTGGEIEDVLNFLLEPSTLGETYLLHKRGDIQTDDIVNQLTNLRSLSPEYLGEEVEEELSSRLGRLFSETFPNQNYDMYIDEDTDYKAQDFADAYTGTSKVKSFADRVRDSKSDKVR